MTDQIASLTANMLTGARPAHEIDPPEVGDAAWGKGFWSTADGPTFAEFLDVINPLQHIPLVSTAYRAITGDEIGQGARMAGGLLYGGPIGVVASALTGLVEEATGGDIGTHIASLFDELTGGGETEADTGQVAAGDEDTAAQAASNPAAEAALSPAAQAALNSAAQAALSPAKRAANPAAEAASNSAGRLNRISYDPAAAFGVPMGGGSGKDGGQPFFPAQPMGLAIPAKAAASPAAKTARTEKTAAESAKPAPAGRADALLARWAERQMAKQAGAAAANAPAAAPASPQATAETETPKQEAAAALPRGSMDTGGGSAAAAPHPMLPPENATAEWYAQAMGQALSRYQAAQQAGKPSP